MSTGGAGRTMLAYGSANGLVAANGSASQAKVPLWGNRDKSALPLPPPISSDTLRTELALFMEVVDVVDLQGVQGKGDVQMPRDHWTRVLTGLEAEWELLGAGGAGWGWLAPEVISKESLMVRVGLQPMYDPSLPTPCTAHLQLLTDPFKNVIKGEGGSRICATTMVGWRIGWWRSVVLQ
ncbi:uncharacterized protein BT62DRAFT_923628 [Guyanagaster necrorhizus]|uniref:Uncharacterized protein n=1 Tax=Guyanagaster necrorhizus TaxID=856835 RepID=A0A9P8AMA4_9AGAR|nr:uncharacterized protein BT62DRAFT_923628 [Guyanagaster necrorhizus MCA 3950]KAG7441063.1 hypothetical protein BT62DRAFT_923628 [Guyanagaster necrorhizus MCA 3950]